MLMRVEVENVQRSALNIDVRNNTSNIKHQIRRWTDSPWRTSNIRRWLDRSWWRRENNADRRAGVAFSESQPERKNRHLVARSKRSWRRCTAGGSCHDDQLAGRSRFHAQHGHAWTSRRPVARNTRLSRPARSVEFRLGNYRDGGNRSGSDAISEKWNCRSDGAGNESRLRQPFTITKNCHAGFGQYRGGEQKRSSARAHSAH